MCIRLRGAYKHVPETVIVVIKLLGRRVCVCLPDGERRINFFRESKKEALRV